jgi:hypothetical protein
MSVNIVKGVRGYRLGRLINEVEACEFEAADERGRVGGLGDRGGEEEEDVATAEAFVEPVHGVEVHKTTGYSVSQSDALGEGRAALRANLRDERCWGRKRGGVGILIDESVALGFMGLVQEVAKASWRTEIK